MTYTFADNYLYSDGKIIYQAPSEIEGCLANSFNDSAVIVYDGRALLEDPGLHLLAQPKVSDELLHEKINQNVLCIDRDGNILWRVEKTSDYPYPFSQVFQKNGELWAYRDDREEYCIDPATGKILKYQPGL